MGYPLCISMQHHTHTHTKRHHKRHHTYQPPHTQFYKHILLSNRLFGTKMRLSSRVQIVMRSNSNKKPTPTLPVSPYTTYSFLMLENTSYKPETSSEKLPLLFLWSSKVSTLDEGGVCMVCCDHLPCIQSPVK